MEIKVNTKFNIGDKAYRSYFNGYSPIEIIGIEIHIDGKGKIDTYYQYQPYSDSNIVDIAREESLRTREQVVIK